MGKRSDDTKLDSRQPGAIRRPRWPWRAYHDRLALACGSLARSATAQADVEEARGYEGQSRLCDEREASDAQVRRTNAAVDRAYCLEVKSIEEAAAMLSLVLMSDSEALDGPVLTALGSVAACLRNMCAGAL